MHRSQSTLSSILDRKDSSNKKSLWGTIKIKRRQDEPAKRRSFRALSVSSNTSSNPSAEADAIRAPKTARKQYNTLSATSSSSFQQQHQRNASSQSSSNSRPVSMMSYSLDPNMQHPDKNEPSPAHSARNSIYSIRSSAPTNDSRAIPRALNAGASSSNSNRFSRIFDVDLFNTEDTSPTKGRHTGIGSQTAPSNTHSTMTRSRVSNEPKSKRFSMMFGSDNDASADFLNSLKAIPSNPESTHDTIPEEPNNILTAAFEDYKLALEAYGVGTKDIETSPEDDLTEDAKADPAGDDSKNFSSSSLTSSYLQTDVDEINEEMEVKLFSNCIWIGGSQTSIFENAHTKQSGYGLPSKLNKIDLKMNEDLNSVFDDEEENEELKENSKRIVQRTSLYFT